MFILHISYKPLNHETALESSDPATDTAVFVRTIHAGAWQRNHIRHPVTIAATIENSSGVARHCLNAS